MATLGDFLILLGLGGTIWGAVRLFRQRKHPSTKRLNLILLIGSIILMFIGTPMSDTKTSTGSTSQSSVVNKRLTTKQRKLLNTERTHGKVLLAVKAKKNAELKALTKEQKKLEAAADERASSSRAAAASSSLAASTSASQAESASKAAAASIQAAASSQAAANAAAAKQAEEAQKSAAQQQAAPAQQQTPTNQGDLYTGTQGTIVGNSRSKIYHVPGQAGYHMNAANAVYFHTEAEASSAGYRKALR